MRNKDMKTMKLTAALLLSVLLTACGGSDGDSGGVASDAGSDGDSSGGTTPQYDIYI